MLDPVLLVALLAAWRPPEVFPWSAPLLAAGGIACIASLRKLSRPRDPRVHVWASGFITLIAVSWLAGWDRSAIVPLAGLTALVAVVGWSAASHSSEGVERKLALGLAALALWGFYQLVWAYPLLEKRAEHLPETFRQAVLHRASIHRAVAGLALPGHLAILLVMALPILLDGLRRGPRRLAWGAAVLLDLGGIAATRSLIGASLALLVMLILAPRRGRAWLVPAVGLAAVFVLLSRQDLLSSLEPVVQRLDNWRTALWVWWQSPALGVGPGGFRQAAQAVPFPVSSVSAYAHDLPLQALAELGPAGLLASLLGLAWIARLVLRGWTSERPLAMAVAVVPLHNMVDFSLFVSGVAVPWAMLTGLLWARTAPDRAWPLLSRRSRTVLTGLGLAALGLATLTAFSRSLQETGAASGDPRSALRAVQVAPWRIPPRLQLAGTALEKGSTAGLRAEASRSIETGLRLAPRSAALWLAAARLDLVTGDPLMALTRVRRAVECHPGWEPASRFLEQLRRELEAPP